MKQLKEQKEQLIQFLKKKRDKCVMFSAKWSDYNNKIYKLKNLKNEKTN